MDKLVFDIFIGTYAGTFSALLGLLGALALAKAPLESIRSRRALVQLLALGDDLRPAVYSSARIKLIAEAERMFETERRWNKYGAILLCGSFAILLANSGYITTSGYMTGGH